MQSCDVFESFKVIVTSPVFAEVNSWDRADTENLIEKSKNQPYNLIAIFDKTTTIYKDENVKTISNGYEWTLLDDFIALIKSDMSNLTSQPGEERND